jgi:hypothetical protein
MSLQEKAVHDQARAERVAGEGIVNSYVVAIVLTLSPTKYL